MIRDSHPLVTDDLVVVLATKTVFADRFLFGFAGTSGVGVALKSRKGVTTQRPCASIAVEKKAPPFAPAGRSTYSRTAYPF